MRLARMSYRIESADMKAFVRRVQLNHHQRLLGEFDAIDELNACSREVQAVRHIRNHL